MIGALIGFFVGAILKEGFDLYIKDGDQGDCQAG
jgi:hypothetical protein